MLGPSNREGQCVLKPCPPFRNDPVGPISELFAIWRGGEGGGGVFTAVTDNAGSLLRHQLWRVGDKVWRWTRGFNIYLFI